MEDLCVVLAGVFDFDFDGPTRTIGAGFAIMSAVLFHHDAAPTTPPPQTPSSPADEGNPHAPGDVSNDQVFVRGGQGAPPTPGTYSGAQGSTVEEAGKGVPNGSVQVTTGAEIRAAGGNVRPSPLPAYPGGPMNGRHVNINGGQGAFSPPVANPAPKETRIPGGNTKIPNSN
jgi:hypothetical protein